MKPHSVISPFTPALVAFVVGSAMWIGAGAKLANSDKNHFEFRPNILAIKGSPLGKTLALAIQGDINLAWHEGVSNPFEAHDHSNCDHDHDHDLCTDDHTTPTELPEAKSWLRNQVDQMTASVYSNNSPYGLTERHRRHIRENIEHQVEFAYSLDPENYTNYNTLHLFYETTLGNDQKSADQLIELAQKTRASIREFTVDPEPWATAASTQSNICDVLVNHLGLEGHEQQFVDHLNDMRQCLIRFDLLRHEKVRNGSWEKISAVRREQMLERFFQLVKQHSIQSAIYTRLTKSRNVPTPAPALEMTNTPTS